MIWLLAGATLARMLVAAILPLGNDELVYWEYARYPDWSYFDHPPMVGWVIRLCSANLLLQDELFIRLGAIVLAALNTCLMFSLGRTLKNARAGFFAALLFTASPYTSLIAGTFILPDAPQLFFWLLCIRTMLHTLPNAPSAPGQTRNMLLLGVFIGLTMLSKYHGAYLWPAAVAYVLLANRAWLLRPALYGAGCLSILCFAPVLYWNYTNDFVSFLFQGGRVTAGAAMHPIALPMQILEQVAYQNPVNVLLIIFALVACLRRKCSIEPGYLELLLLLSLPLIGAFTAVALFHDVLPHWAGPGYVALMLLAGAHLAQRGTDRIPFSLKGALAYAIFLAFGGVATVCAWPGQFGEKDDTENLGKGDVTLDFQGWDQVRAALGPVLAREEAAGRLHPGVPILSHRWYPAGHLDYYVATPLNRRLLGVGNVGALRTFAWVSRRREGLKPGQDAVFIDLSTAHLNPENLFGQNFRQIVRLETIPLTRGGVHVRNATVYLLLDCLTPPEISGFPRQS